MDIVKDGQPRTAIVIPDEAFPVVECAAKELQYHAQRSTGAVLAICRESQKPSTFKGLIFLGNCNETRRAGIETQKLPPSGFVIRTAGNDLFLAGHDSDRPIGSHWNSTLHGTLYAVYEFLEKEMNVRWLWPGKLGEVVPRRVDIEIGAWDQFEEPRFLETHLAVKITTNKQKRYWSSSEHYDQYAEDQRVWLLRQRLNTNTQYTNYGHAFHNAQYWERFHKTHPEFFQLLPDGTRGHIPGLDGHKYTMCVSNPGLHRQIVEDWKDNPRRNPDHIPYSPFVNACENDTGAACTCANCRAWDAPDPRFKNHDYWGDGKLVPNMRYQMVTDSQGRPGPSLSDRYARFYLAVLAEAQKVDPDAIVAGYAYSNYGKPPVQTKLSSNILIVFVSWLEFPWTDERTKEMRKSWDGWAATGARMKLRPNTMLSGHNMPIFLARKLGNEISRCAKSGMIATYFDSLTGQWATQGPNLYVLARAHVRPDWPVDKLLDEYYGGFGNAKPAVRNYFEHWEQVSDALTMEQYERYRKEVGGAGWGNWYKVAPLIFTTRVMAKGRNLLIKAQEEARGDSLAEQRVSFLEKGLKHAELTLAASAAHRKYKQSGDITEFAAAVRELDNYRASVESDNIANMGFLHYCESTRSKSREWDRQAN